jgi:hypothetical protein
MAREMSYVRGQKLTPEERAGGGQGAGRDIGLSPEVQSLLFGGPSFSDFNIGGYGGGGGGEGDQQRNLRALLNAWLQQQQNESRTQLALPGAVYSAQRQAQDPVGWRAKQKDVASMGPTFDEAFAGHRAADTMTPAQIMASQGMTAANQWASQLPAGAVTPSGVDADELRRINAQQAGRFRTYM